MRLDHLLSERKAEAELLLGVSGLRPKTSRSKSASIETESNDEVSANGSQESIVTRQRKLPKTKSLKYTGRRQSPKPDGYL